MVSKGFRRKCKGLRPIAFLAALLAILLCCAAPADTSTRVEIELDYSITVNKVGDAHIAGTFVFSDSLFKPLAKIVDKHPEYLTRRYTVTEGLQDIRNAKAKLDESDKAVVVSYDCPGYAYNWGDHWEIEDFEKKPKKQSKNKMTFEEVYIGRGDLTFQQELPVKRTRVVSLPKAATGIKHLSDSGAITYSLKPDVEQYGFFQEYKTVLTIGFGALALFLTLLFLFVLFRGRQSTPLIVQGGATGAAEIKTPSMESIETAYCPDCGREVPPDQKYCTGCGRRL